jgi:hypothetical protein
VIAGLAAIAVLASGMMLASRTSRRVLVLLTALAYCFLAPLVMEGARLESVSLLPALLVYLPPLVILGLAAGSARRGGAGRPARSGSAGRLTGAPTARLSG